jgi:hypothetical protein
MMKKNPIKFNPFYISEILGYRKKGRKVLNLALGAEKTMRPLIALNM